MRVHLSINHFPFKAIACVIISLCLLFTPLGATSNVYALDDDLNLTVSLKLDEYGGVVSMDISGDYQKDPNSPAGLYYIDIHEGQNLRISLDRKYESKILDQALTVSIEKYDNIPGDVIISDNELGFKETGEVSIRAVSDGYVGLVLRPKYGSGKKVPEATKYCFFGLRIYYAKDDNVDQAREVLTAYEKLVKLLNSVDSERYLPERNVAEIARECGEENVLKASQKAVEGCTDTYQKIRAICMYVADEIYYDYPYYDNIALFKDLPKGYKVSTSPSGTLSLKRSVCAGYARLSQRMCFYSGIPCIYIENTDHAYNAAYDDESRRWVIFDATWCSGNQYTLEEGAITHSSIDDYFDMSFIELVEIGSHQIESLANITSGNEKNGYYSFQDELISYELLDMSKWLLSLDAVKGKKYKVPESIAGIPVTHIQLDEGFGTLDMSDMRISSLENVVAVYGKKIVFPDTLTSVKADYISAVKTIDMGNSDIWTVKTGDFGNYLGLEKLIISSRTREISKNAFKDQLGLRVIDLSNVKRIGAGAFDGAVSLRKIYVSGNITSIGKNAFREVNSSAVVYVRGNASQVAKIRKMIESSGAAPNIKVKAA